MNPIPARAHAPSNIVTYTDALDWRAKNIAGAVPFDTNSVSRYWVDTAAIQRISQIQRLKDLIPGFTAQNRTYSYITRNSLQNLVRLPIGSNDFHQAYAQSMAHKTAVQTMIDYKWVYELQGMPPAFTVAQFSESLASIPNFDGKDPRYPLELRSDHIYFPIGEDLFSLPIREFIQRFQVNTSNYADMRAAVLTLASDAGLSDEQAISMIRLAVQEKPKTPPLI